MADMFYSPGGATANLSAGATTVNFTGTALLANVKPGDTLLAAGGSSSVVTVTDDDTLTIFPAWPGETSATAAFKIMRGSGWASTAAVAADTQYLVTRLKAGLMLAPNAAGRAGTSDRDQHDNAPRNFLYFEAPEEGDPVHPPLQYLKLSDATADWSEGISAMGAPGADGATVAEVLAELGVNNITISTSDPSGGSNNDLWFKVPA